MVFSDIFRIIWWVMKSCYRSESIDSAYRFKPRVNFRMLLRAKQPKNLSVKNIDYEP